MPRKADQLPGQFECEAQSSVLQVQVELFCALLGHPVFRPFPKLGGEGTGHILRQPHHLADLAHRATGAVANHSGADGGPVTAITWVRIPYGTPSDFNGLSWVACGRPRFIRHICGIHGAGWVGTERPCTTGRSVSAPKACRRRHGAREACRAPFAREDGAIQRMLELRATTPAGIQARAHSLALMNGHGDWSWDPEGIHGQMLAALLRDAAAIGGTQVALPPSPDAELLALCADYMATWQAVQNHPVASLVGEIPKDLEDSYGELLDKLGSLTEEIAALHVVTSEGRRAKAAV